ncbi:MAG: flagellar basal body P-ring protein FlgI [Pirellulales bacterium]|nr:flagellar basal body P-ring protein FlgI [Pirellulales bacterium]
MTHTSTNDPTYCEWRLLVAALVFFAGCSGPILRPQSPEARIDLPPMPDVKYVSSYAHPYGMNYVKVEAVSLVTGLNGTGSDPPPTSQRAMLLDEMQRREIANPNEVLASPNTAMVLVRAFLRPGIQVGDRFDIEVRSPSGSDTTSLRDGWLLPTRLSEMAVLDQQIHEGHVMGMAEGPVLVDPTADAKKDPALATRGRVLSGGVATKARPLGLVLVQQHQSVRNSQDIAHAINRRFYTFVNGRKQGVSTPKTAEFIDIVLHPRYHDNTGRYMQVLRNIAINETAQSQQTRMLFLEQQLNDPLTAANAAMRLEAIGDDQSRQMLKQGLSNGDTEVRFYAAEALAYLDDTAAVEVLTEVARNEASFRVNALAALSAMDDAAAYDSLRSLLEVKSAETRYGAFRSLWAMNQHDPFLHDEFLSDQFHYHVLDVPGPRMIHVTESYLPEIVLFGREQHFELPLMVDAGKSILVKGMNGDQITVSRFKANGEPEQRVVSTSIDEVIRAIVALGGTYPDVVQALQEAKNDGALTSRFEVDALPEPGRMYDRIAANAKAESTAPASSDSEVKPASYDISTPLPDLFGRPR